MEFAPLPFGFFLVPAACGGFVPDIAFRKKIPLVGDAFFDSLILFDPL